MTGRWAARDDSRLRVLSQLAWLALAGCGSSPMAKPPIDGGRPARDWEQYPAVVSLTGTSEIDVLGDVHGDPSVTESVLEAAGLIAPAAGATPPFAWTGGSKVLVVTGDVIDKGQDAISIIDLLLALEPQAAAAGGKLVVTLGNHEAEFVADPTEKKTLQFQQELSQRGYDPVAVAAGQTRYGAWLLTRPVAALVDGWFFCHAGNSQGMSATQIAAAYQADFADTGEPQFNDDFLIGSHSLLEDEQWWVGGAASTSIQNLDFDLTDLPADHIVFGHDPGEIDFTDDPAGDRAPGQMVSRYGGRIFLIDVGMSYAVGYSKGSLLRIVRGTPDMTTQVLIDGTTEPLGP